MIRATSRGLLRAVRWWTWLRVLTVGVVLMGVSGAVTTITNYDDEKNEHRNDEVERAQLVAVTQQVTDLTHELACYRQAAAQATALESEMGRQLALGLTDLFLDVEAGQDVAEHEVLERAEAIREIGDQLGGVNGSPGEIEQRQQAAVACGD
jgi:hypothetical protein